MQNRFASLGIKIPEILLPGSGVDLSKWAVVACDQFTSEPKYWEQVYKQVGENRSTLHLVLPEIFLEKGDTPERIAAINRNMRAYLEEQVFAEPFSGFIYTERTTGSKTRKGLMLAVDLECYDYRPGSTSLIRATEGTVLERIPPRVKIRSGAVLESPHIMLLIDDPEGRVIEPLTAQTDSLPLIYDVQLMLGGGRLRGFQVPPALMNGILKDFQSLADREAFNRKYGTEDLEALLFAVGDGNHSLATAKAVWEQLKAENPGLVEHPARYALVEVINLHDTGLEFEPIHRVLFGVEPAAVLAEMTDYFALHGSEAVIIEGNQSIPTGAHLIKFRHGQGDGAVAIGNPRHNLAVGSLQAFLDDLMKKDPRITVDYIHGDNVVDSLAKERGNIGFYLPAMDKQALFKTVILEGALPRKTFSMGEAQEKRYYLECRKIG